MSGSQTYELRPLLEAEYDAMTQVWHDSASLPGVGPPVMPGLAELRERVDVEVAAGWVVTVAVRANHIIGFTAIKPREAVLDQLFVRPQSIGAGVGRSLLAHAMIAMPGGFTLHTAATNARARAFYEKAGLIYLRNAAHPRTGHPVIYYGWKGG